MEYVDTLKLTDENDEIITEYTAHCTKVVILSARVNEDVATVEILEEKVNVIRDWMNNWHPLIPKIEFPQSEYKAEWEVKKTSVEVMLEIDEIVVLNAKWLANSGKVTFQPRAEIVMSTPDFILFFRHIRKFYQTIKEASAGQIV